MQIYRRGNINTAMVGGELSHSVKTAIAKKRWNIMQERAKQVQVPGLLSEHFPLELMLSKLEDPIEPTSSQGQGVLEILLCITVVLRFCRRADRCLSGKREWYGTNKSDVVLLSFAEVIRTCTWRR